MMFFVGLKRRERYTSMVYRSPKLILFIGQRKKSILYCVEKGVIFIIGHGV